MWVRSCAACRRRSVFVTSRRERERDEFRERVLGAAVAIAHAEGWANVSMRRIAEAIEYTAPALYHHFENKDAVVAALRQRGYRLLLQRFERIRSADPVDRLNAMARHHVDFAFEHPELFNAMYGLGGMSCESPDAPIEAQLVAGIVHSSARPVFEGDGGARPGFDDEIDALWASLHGIVSMALGGPVEGGRTRARSLSALTLTNTLTAWSSTMRASASKQRR